MKKLYNYIIVTLLALTIFSGCSNQSERITNTTNASENTNSSVANTKPEQNKNELNDATNSKNKEESSLQFNTYRNARYGFSIRYPNTYKVNEYSDNGDGAKISSDKAEILAYGSNNIFDYDASLYYNFIAKDIKGDIKYKAINDNWFVVSWIEQDMIKYQKSVIGKGSVDTFIFSYPRNEAKDYDLIVNELSSSFKTPSINEGH